MGRRVVVLDTPACFSLTSDLLGPDCVLLLVLNVSSSFSAGQAEALEKQVEAAGAWAWSRTAVLFSHGDWLGSTSLDLERRVESEGPALQRLLEQCGNRYHVLDNKHWGHGAQVEELVELVEQMLVEERRGEAERLQVERWRSSRPPLVQAGKSNICRRW